jgi:hypothetical protein
MKITLLNLLILLKTNKNSLPLLLKITLNENNTSPKFRKPK